MSTKIEATRHFDGYGYAFYRCPDCQNQVGGVFDPVHSCSCGHDWQKPEPLPQTIFRTDETQVQGERP